MKRIFKFRAWDPRWERMTYFDEADPLVSSPTLLSGFVLAHNTGGDEVLMQWTGFIDSEGRDIYEGDVVRLFGLNSKVEWGRVSGSWVLRTKGEDIASDLSTDLELDNGKVIGNVYENPELIEGGNENGD